MKARQVIFSLAVDYFRIPLTETGAPSSAQVLTMAAQPVFPLNKASDITPVIVQGSDNIYIGATPDQHSVKGYVGGIESMESNQNAVLLAASGDIYPFNDQFHPDDQAGLLFDPFAENFSAFDVSSTDINWFLEPEMWRL